jgi:1-phosphatidylinositol-4-phosphate 5-kinase
MQDQISNIDKSFDLIKNSDQLYKICGNNGGGRSGEFFFFSCDNKYILKTVNKEEFQTLLEELQLFYQHFTNYPDTLICKIYGMFKICHK